MSFSLSPSLCAYISIRRIKQNVMIERLLAPTPPTQLTELTTETSEVLKKDFLTMKNRFLNINFS